MGKKKITVNERNLKLNEQRFAMAIVLMNILESKNGVSHHIKAAISASLINMIDTIFIPGEDDELAELINNSIDGFCKEVEVEHGVKNFRSNLNKSINKAKDLVGAITEKISRIKDGEDILKSINLN